MSGLFCMYFVLLFSLFAIQKIKTSSVMTLHGKSSWNKVIRKCPLLVSYDVGNRRERMSRDDTGKNNYTVDEFNYEVGKRLANYRNAKGLTQQALGMRVGRKANAIRAYEAGRVAIPIDMVVKLSKELGFSIEELLLGNDGSFESMVEKNVKQLSANRITLYIRLLSAELSTRDLRETK